MHYPYAVKLGGVFYPAGAEISAPTMDKASETSEQAAEVAITPPIAPVKNKGGRPPKKSAN